MTDRDQILASLPDGASETAPTQQRLVVKTVPQDKLWETFEERFQAHAGEIKTLQDLAQFADQAICDDDVPKIVKSTLGQPAPSVWEAELGVTTAELAIAETGSLVLVAKAGTSRLASLAPPIHAVIVKKGQVVSSLEEAIARLPAQTSVIVTGPSRTADVEGVMVMGVHGPKRLWVVVQAESEPE